MKSYIKYWPRGETHDRPVATFYPYLLDNHRPWPAGYLGNRTPEERAYQLAIVDMFELIYTHVDKQDKNYIFWLE